MMKRLITIALLLFLIILLLLIGLGFNVERINPNAYDAKIDRNRYLALPIYGENYKANSYLAYSLGRYYLKGAVALTIIDAYKALEKTQPDIHFIYGEMGLKGGGKFYPHRTHQAGLSADFITPVYSLRGNKKISTVLPTSIFHLWGYRVRLDNQGNYGESHLDTSALINHLAALDDAGKKNNVRIQRVILDPEYVSLLKKDPAFNKIKHLNFMTTKAWFPHDGHYHVDFIMYE